VNFKDQTKDMVKDRIMVKIQIKDQVKVMFGTEEETKFLMTI
jgi:hypothetical protein